MHEISFINQILNKLANLDDPLDVHLSEPENEERPFFDVVQVPTAGKVFLYGVRQLVLRQDLETNYIFLNNLTHKSI